MYTCKLTVYLLAQVLHQSLAYKSQTPSLSFRPWLLVELTEHRLSHWPSVEPLPVKRYYTRMVIMLTSPCMVLILYAK